MIDLTQGIPQSTAPPSTVPAFGENPWDVQQREDDQADAEFRQTAQAKLDQVALDPDSYFAGKDLGFTRDPKKSQAMALNSAFMEFASGDMPIPLGESDINRRLIRQDLAMRLFEGRGADTEEAFHGEIVKAAQGRKDTGDLFQGLGDASAMAVTAGSVGESATTFSAWRESAKSSPGYKPENDADYLEAWHQTQQEAKARIEPFREELASVWQAMKAGGAGTASELIKSVGADLLLGGGSDGEDTVDEFQKKDAGAVAFEVYQKLSEAERADFMAGLDTLVKTFPKEERPAVLANLAKSGGRMVDAPARGAAARFSVKGLEQYLNQGIADSAGPLGASAADKAEAASNATRIQADRLAQKNFADGIRKIERGEYAPVRYFSQPSKDVFSMRTLEDGLYGIPGVFASVGTVMLPGVGPGAMYLAMEDFAYGDLRDNAMRAGMSDEAASLFADDWKSVAAVPQTALEVLQTYIPLGKLPAVSKVLGTLGDQITNRLLRGVAKAASIGAAETTIEELQNLTPYAVQEIAHAFAADTGTPDANWTGKGGAFDGFWTRQATTFLSLLPMAAFGAVGGLNAEARAKAFTEASPRQLRAYGLTNDQIASLHEAKAAGPSSLNAKLDEVLTARDPNSPEAAEAAAAEAQAAGERQAAVAAAQGTGILPRIVQTADGMHAVIDSETGEVVGTANTPAQALRLAAIHSTGVDSMKAEVTDYIINQMETGLEALALSGDQNAQNSFELSTHYTAAVAAAENPASIDRFQKQETDKELINGGDGSVAMSALGRNVAEIRNQVRTFTNRLFQGSSVRTIIHETGHGMLRRAWADGSLTRAETLQIVQTINQAMGERRMKKGAFKGEKAALMDEAAYAAGTAEDQDRMLHEAVAEFLEANMMKDRKPSGKKLRMLDGGTVNRNLKATTRYALSLLPKSLRTKFETILNAVRGVVGMSAMRAVLMKKAIRDGTLKEADIEAFLDKLTGRDLQAEHDSAVREERAAIVGDAEFEVDEDNPFSLAPSNPEREARHLAPLVISSEKLPGSKRDWHKAIREYIGNHLIGRTLTNLDSERSITFTGTSKREAPSKLRKESAFRAAMEIKEITEESVFLGNLPSQGGKEATYNTVSYFAMPVVIDGREAVAWFNALDPKSGKDSVFYEFGLFEQKNRPGLPEESLSDSGESSASSKPGPAQTVGEFLDKIKDTLPAAIKVAAVDSSPFSLGPATANENGKPVAKMMKHKVIDVTFPDVAGKMLSQQHTNFPMDLSTAGAFSLAPAAMVDALSLNVAARITDPRARGVVFSNMMRKLGDLKRDKDELALAFGKGYKRKAIEDPRKTASINKEAAFREAARRAELEEIAAAKYGKILNDDDLVKIKAQPVHEMLSVKRADGKVDTLRGRLMSPTAAAARGETFFDAGKQGDYDGASNIARTNYGGTLMPDQAAQELFDAGLIKEPTPDAMWQAMEREQNSVAKFKEYLKAAQEDLKAARVQAKAEAAKWKAERLKEEKANYSPKARLLRALALLDGIISSLPISERGRIGGYTQLAKLETDEVRLRFLNERIDKVDEVLEKYLVKEYGRMLDKLLDRSIPKKGAAGEKPKGTAGAEIHEIFAVLRQAREWTQDEVDAHVDGLLSVIASGNLTAAEVARMTMQANLVGLVGNWKEADSVRRAAAVVNATNAFESGYSRFRLALLLKQEDQTIRRRSLAASTKAAGTAAARDLKMLADNGLKGTWKDNFLSLISFEQLNEYLFGRDSQEARAIVDGERLASNQKEDVIQAKMDALDDLFADLGGSQLAGEKLRWDLSQKNLTIGGRTLSAFEAITVTLMWRQEDGRRHMEGHKDENGNFMGPWHYDQKFVDDCEAALSDEAKAVRLHIADQYAGEYATLNPVFKALNGINLPSNPNYSPLTVKPVQAAGGQGIDPVTGSTMSGASMTPGSLRTRGQAIAEPDFRDALQTYIAHTKQIQHWIAYAPFMDDVGAILRNRELGNSIEEKGGAQALSVLRSWLDLFMAGGVRDASAHLALNGMMNRMLGRTASAVLVGRLSVLAIQTTQLAAGLAEMPTGSFAARFGKLITGQLEWGAAFRSEYIQRRLSQMPASVQQAMAGLKASRPNRVKHWVQKTGLLISGVDALMTAGTFAMVHDYQLGQAKALGLTGPEADAYALAAAERAVDRIAQPTRPGTRSLFENTTTNPAMRVLWAFASESRQKLALSLWRLAAKDRTLGEKTRALAVTWVVGGMLATVMRAAMRDIKDDGEDDEIFDERNWGAKRLALSSLTGPFGGIPFIGDMLEGGVYALAGERLPEGNLLSSMSSAFKAATRASDWGDKKPDQIMRDVETILGRMAFLNDTLSAAASLSHLARDLFGIAANLSDD